MLATASKFDVGLSITARQNKRVRAAIEAIDEQAWHPIPYWLSTAKVSGADIAETTFTVFAGDTRHARAVRLVVRRVRPTAGSQLALFTTSDYHAFITDRTLPLPELEADHRRHTIVEQTIAELKSAGLATSRPGTRWPTPPGSPWPSRRTTSAGPSANSPARPAAGDRRHPAAHGLQHARTACAHRPTTTPSAPQVLALADRITTALAAIWAIPLRY